MIPADVAEAVMRPMTYGVVAAAIGDGRTELFRIWTWQLDGDRIRLFVGRPFDARLDLIGAGTRIAFTTASPDATAYQMKGACIGVRRPTDEEKAFDAQHLARWSQMLVEAGYAKDAAVHAVMQPGRKVVEVQVDALFDQRPGPNAGRGIGAA